MADKIVEDLGNGGTCSYVEHRGLLTIPLPSGKVAIIRCDVEDVAKNAESPAEPEQQVAQEPEPEPTSDPNQEPEPGPEPPAVGGDEAQTEVEPPTQLA